MQVDLDRDGLAHLTLQPGERIAVNIGGAEVILMGGLLGTPGEGPLVQIVSQTPTARLALKHRVPPEGSESFTVRVIEDGER
jgi:hypothetical protein